MNNFMPTAGKQLDTRGKSEPGADSFKDVKRLIPS